MARPDHRSLPSSCSTRSGGSPATGARWSTPSATWAHPNVTKRVRLLVAADPDTMSGKARKARAYGIPIVTPDAFSRMVSVPDR
ncbi:hypothetical protein AB0I81_51835 [Nonomuraea sp. NPDC050404]|uniref:hypothetical protein n=1 Tax=Nonomuraea sp. NPDC050404 TaxID=3155783 RepID=UPI0034010577